LAKPATHKRGDMTISATDKPISLAPEWAPQKAIKRQALK
jgi:hypothetical protein